MKSPFDHGCSCIRPKSSIFDKNIIRPLINFLFQLDFHNDCPSNACAGSFFYKVGGSHNVTSEYSVWLVTQFYSKKTFKKKTLKKNLKT